MNNFRFNIYQRIWQNTVTAGQHENFLDTFEARLMWQNFLHFIRIFLVQVRSSERSYRESNQPISKCALCFQRPTFFYFFCEVF